MEWFEHYFDTWRVIWVKVETPHITYSNEKLFLIMMARFV